MADLNLSGFVYDAAGCGISGLTVSLFDKNTTCPARATDTTDANGAWDFTVGNSGCSCGNHYNDTCACAHEFDVQAVQCCAVVRHKFDVRLQVREVETANLLLRYNSGLFKYDIVPAAITADRQLTLPLITGTQKLIATGTPLLDCETLVLGTGSDASIKYDGSNLVIQPRDTGCGNTVINDAGILFLNDSANARMTTGITVNQGAADDESLSLKSSDVAHSMTSIAEADTYATFTKDVAASGGVRITGLSEAAQGIVLRAGVTCDTTGKTTNTESAIVLDAGKHTAGNIGVMGTDANLVQIDNSGTTRFIFDGEGSAHADVEWTTFDAFCDLQLVHDIEKTLLPDSFGNALEHDRQSLEELGIIGQCSWEQDGCGRIHAMVNFTRLQMLHHGALMQMGERLKAIETENAELRLQLQQGQ